MPIEGFGLNINPVIITTPVGSAVENQTAQIEFDTQTAERSSAIPPPRNYDRVLLEGPPQSAPDGDYETLPPQTASDKASALGKTGRTECQTCANRKYQDQSNDSGVSYQTPTKISPQAAGAAVMSHELEHVSREKAFAEREGREVVSQTVSLKFDICPECGRTYVAGGETRTVTKEKAQKPETTPSAQEEK